MTHALILSTALLALIAVGQRVWYRLVIRVAVRTARAQSGLISAMEATIRERDEVIAGLEGTVAALWVMRGEAVEDWPDVIDVK